MYYQHWSTGEEVHKHRWSTDGHGWSDGGREAAPEVHVSVPHSLSNHLRPQAEIEPYLL